jgi:hypothetical protein
VRRHLAALVFAALVIATVGAFFVTTRLKRSPAVIERLTFIRHFSPNGDGRRDAVVFSVRLRRHDDATVLVVTRDGDRVRTLAENRDVRAHRTYRFRWDGRTDSGRRARDGEYHLRLGLRRQGRTVTSPRKVFLDSRPPRVIVRSVTPDVIAPDGIGGGERAVARFTGPSRTPELLVYRTDRGRPRLVARRPGERGSERIVWDGRVGLGRKRSRAPTGSYALVVRARDAAGNVGPSLPPRRGGLRGNPGVTVRYLAARGPLTPVAPRSLVRFSVFAEGRRYRWRLRRLGSSRSVDRGSSRARSLTVRAPVGRSGVALLEIRIGARRYVTPFAVDEHRGRGVLVVLPAATWQAVNPVESDGDGFPDVLPSADRVSLRRPFAGAGFPRGFLAGDAPALLALRRDGQRFDLTTDIALARPGAGSLGRYSGVLFTSAPVWTPRETGRVLRSYVRVGGRVAWLGTDGLLRTAALSGAYLSEPSRRPPANLFGEPVRPAPAGALAVLEDRIGFFAGVAAALGPYPRLEESPRPAPGARVLATAGARLGRASISVYRVPDGVVARIGARGFAASLATSADATRIMRRLWTLLSR